MDTFRFATPAEAEQAFYHAFARADEQAMMQVWLNAEHIECIHPAGPRLLGPDAIRHGWQMIFTQGERLQFQIQHQHRTQSGHLAIHSVNEHITRAEQPAETALVLTTNIYELTPHGWRMTLHHASPAQAIEAQSAGTMH